MVSSLFAILAPVAFAKFRAKDALLKALTVLLSTSRLPAVAPPKMSFFDF
jgi:hypothetical protein